MSRAMFQKWNTLWFPFCTLATIGPIAFIFDRQGGRCPSPPHALPQAGDVSHVVFSVPGVERDILPDRPRAALGVGEGAGKIGRTKRLERRDPALVQGFEQGGRRRDGRAPHLRRFRPARETGRSELIPDKLRLSRAPALTQTTACAARKPSATLISSPQPKW